MNKQSKYYKHRVCELCGEEFYGAGRKCQPCRFYLKLHPEGLYPQPERGEVLYADNGDPVCHICRKAYRKLGNHIRFYHHISQKEYRERFGLHHNTKLSNEDYINMMFDYNMENYDVVVKENLLEGGKGTRLITGNEIPRRKIGNNQIVKRLAREVDN